MADPVKCPVCSQKAFLAELYRGGGRKLNCVRCGLFEIGDISAHQISVWSPRQRANLTGWIRENKDCKILSPDLKVLASLRTPTVGEKVEKLLIFLASEFPNPGEQIATNIFFSVQEFNDSSVERPKVFIDAEKLVGVSWALDLGELEFLVYDYLIAEKHFLASVAESNLRITPQGWSQIDSVRRGNSASKNGFIAMWFNESVDIVLTAINAAIRDAGYNPLRVDKTEHNNKIDDEIIAGIRRSKFLVADLTSHRPNVYYEAGFAMGIGLPVIWTCRQDFLEATHFDTRQYPLIPWKPDNLSEFSKALQNRIEATIGHGPLLQTIST
jgi:hypothetical protein